MLPQLPGILVPFLIAFFQVITAALAIGLIPALWNIGSRKHWMMFTRWSIFFIIFVAAAFGLHTAMTSWRTWVTEPAFKKSGMYFAYFVGLLLAFFIIPEPKRIARERMRHERRRLPRRGYHVD